MRTVTFSDPAVAKALYDRFICTWINREPGFHNCDLKAERRISELQVFATRNFVTFFATPDLDVLHYASGYYAPKLFLDELKVVHELKDAALDSRNRFMLDAHIEYADVHSRHVRCHVVDEELEAKHGLVPREHHYVEGARHLTAVHKDLAARSLKEQGPVPLDAVFKTYLFGNGFEEHKSSDRPPRDPKSPGMQK